jgi:hypothetical protein
MNKLLIALLLTFAAAAQNVPSIAVTKNIVTVQNVPDAEIESVVILCLKTKESAPGPETREITRVPSGKGNVQFSAPAGYTPLKIAVYLWRKGDPHNPYVFHPSRDNPSKWER